MLELPGLKNISQIHENNHSLIYKAERISDGKFIAVKILKEEFPSLNNIARFNGEYELTHQLKIKGVRQAYEKSKINNKHTLFLDFIEGNSLYNILDSGSLKLSAFLNLAIEITRIINDFHTQNIIHKDINPRNILLDDNNEITIIDFGLAGKLKSISHKAEVPNLLEGSIHYLSPEQTGRMNAGVDYRSDLYSLGITFFQMITGVLPFEGNDSMELIHAHMAKIPTPPTKISAQIPEIISKIILKLIAKNAEDRYQSANGLIKDLEKCKSQLEKNGKIAEFELATEDISSHFHIADKLYGREKETAQLLAEFKKVSEGFTTLTLVAGYSGIGKTALVNELYKPITEKKGYFISGKFDQYTRNIPYSAVLHALKSFVSQILTEPSELIEQWKTRFLKILGNNGQLMVDVVPNLEMVIGKQKPVAELGPTETQNRFNLVFKNFIASICSEEHPLALFIDDWQWADFASLNLLKQLMDDEDIKHLMVLGAYRDNEVDAAHPFIQTVEEIRKGGMHFKTLTLKPLEEKHVNSLVSDTLKTSASKVKALAKLIFHKTGGNPFFVNRFFQTLSEEGLIVFNSQINSWQWDTEEIEKKDITDNVVELMASKIKKLQHNTQEVLKVAACIGNEFALTTLSLLNKKNAHNTLSDLNEALDEGLITTASDDYKGIEEDRNDELITFRFLHDRVQQATYSLIQELERKEINLQLGRLLFQNSTEDFIQEAVIDIANYYNLGSDLISNDEEKLELVKLNLQAGNKAKNATAYHSAIKYYSSGISLLGENPWKKEYDLAFQLYKQHGESEFLLGNFEASDKLLDVALENANDKFDKAEVLIIKIAQLSGQAMYSQATEILNKSLKLFGINAPSLQTSENHENIISKEFDLHEKSMKTKNIEDLFDLPIMTNEEMIICSRSISIALDSIAMNHSDILPFYAAKMVNLSINFGLSIYAPVGFVFFSMIQCALKNFENASKYAALAYNINNDKLINLNIKSKVLHVYGYFSILSNHINFAASCHRKTYQVGLEIGDFVYGSYGLAVSPRFVFPISLEDGLKETLKAIVFFRNANNFPMLFLTKLYNGYGNCLKGLNATKTSFDYEDFTEKKYCNEFEKSSSILIGIYKRYKIQVLCLFNEYLESYQLTLERNTWIPVIGSLDIPLRSDYYLYSGITVSALYSQASKKEQKEYYQILEECIEETQLLADQCEANFLHPLQLLQAEKARIDNNIQDAIQLFDASIENAQKNEYTKDEALACERAAHFYLSINKEDFAQIYMTKAHYAYGIWGATAKVKDLEVKYPHLIKKSQPLRTNFEDTLPVTSIHSTSNSSSGSSSGFDFQSLMKASQAISREIKLENLLKKMMQVIVENAGAQKGVLLLAQDEELSIQAAFHIGDQLVKVLQNQPINESKIVPQSIILYAARTLENLVLSDASSESNFMQDDFIIENKTKSVLCAPILKQGKLRAIIYLENNLSTNVFTQDRLLVLNMLSSQIAISIDNALLYENLEQKVTDRTKELSLQKDKVTQQNQKLETQAQKLLELGKVKSQFFANISHEFRTPLTLILGPLESLLKLPLKPEVAQKLAIINRNAFGLLSLINQLLDLSKAEEGKLELKLVKKDIIKDVSLIAEAFKSLAFKQKITFSFISDRKELTMVYDNEKLEVILNNLLSNAIKFTPEGGKIDFILAHHSDIKELEIQVKDTGIGIDKDKLSQIFDRFYQADSGAKKEYEGTGIGLALTKELVSLYKGKISVNSEPGKGSSFIVHLPVNIDHENIIEVNDLSTEDSYQVDLISSNQEVNQIIEAKPTNKEKDTLLLVEDNEDMRAYLKETLQDRYKIEDAPNGKEGIIKAEQLMPELIISDVMMPQMSGIELTEKLKTSALTSHIPVILLTAKAGIESKLEGLETGADDYLTKPFNHQELHLRVKNLIHQRALLRERYSQDVNLEPKDISVTSADEQFLNKVTELIESHMQNFEFNIEFFAEEMAMSRGQLHKKIKALTDQTPSEFNRRFRLKRAASLIKQKAGNISDISYQVGFNNLNYFSKMFSKMFGVPPSEYQ